MKRLSLSEISIVSFSCVLHHLREEGTIFECIRRALNLQIRIFLLNSAIIVLNTTVFSTRYCDGSPPLFTKFYDIVKVE